MATDDREKQFERALARHWSNASPDSACPDAEILAAYHERTLSLEEMAHWKEHIISCARCQETLALVEQTEAVPAQDGTREQIADLLPAGRFRAMAAAATTAGASQKQLGLPAAPIGVGGASDRKSLRRRPPWRWIAPLGAIAAAVIVSIGVREIRMQHQEQGHVTEMAANRAAESRPDQNSELAMRAEQVAKPQAEPKMEIPRQKTALPTAPRMAPSTGSRSAVSSGRYSLPEKDLAKQKPRTESSNAMEAVTAAPIAPASPDTTTNNRILDAAALPAPAPRPSASAGAEPRKEEQKKARGTNETAVQEQAAPLHPYAADLKTIDKLDGLSIQQLAQLNRHYILSPGEKLAWRLGDAGKIERSTDHGKTWKLQNSTVTTDLTAGSATSDKICWVIGKAGTLLLTTDGGKHWKTIHSPIADDLGGIHARDASHASLWDVPNRLSYETSDGGATWTRVANE